MLVQFTVAGREDCRKCHRLMVVPEVEELELEPEPIPHAPKDSRYWSHVIGANVARIRGKKRMSQLQVALLMGTQRTHITKIERGYGSPGIVVVQRAASALGVSISELLTEPPSPQMKELQADWLTRAMMPYVEKLGVNERAVVVFQARVFAAAPKSQVCM